MSGKSTTAGVLGVIGASLILAGGIFIMILYFFLVPITVITTIAVGVVGLVGSIRIFSEFTVKSGAIMALVAGIIAFIGGWIPMAGMVGLVEVFISGFIDPVLLIVGGAIGLSAANDVI